jgi:hypothetical protein
MKNERNRFKEENKRSETNVGLKVKLNLSIKRGNENGHKQTDQEVRGGGARREEEVEEDGEQ